MEPHKWCFVLYSEVYTFRFVPISNGKGKADIFQMTRNYPAYILFDFIGKFNTESMNTGNDSVVPEIPQRNDRLSLCASGGRVPAKNERFSAKPYAQR